MAPTLLGKMILTALDAKQHMSNYLRRIYYKNILGATDGFFRIEPPIEIRNPEKIALYKNVYIRPNTVMLQSELDIS